MSVQDAADASQSVTPPRVSFVAPELTAATNVTTVPEEMVAPDAREFVPAAMTRLVEVDAGAGAAIALYGSPTISAKQIAASPALKGPKALPRFSEALSSAISCHELVHYAGWIITFALGESLHRIPRVSEMKPNIVTI